MTGSMLLHFPINAYNQLVVMNDPFYCLILTDCESLFGGQ